MTALRRDGPWARTVWAAVAAAVLTFGVALPLLHRQAQDAPAQVPAGAPAAQAGVMGAAPARAAAFAPPAAPWPERRADFRREAASPEARQVAQWAFFTGDAGPRAVVVVDKRQAKVFVFEPTGRLRGAAPVLLGSAIGDDTVPGVGDKPVAQVLPHERTTPAGRFVAEPGLNANGEDVVWVDYDAAVSMHRVRPNVKSERRLQRLASATPADNRISYGCINLPRAFYEQVLSPTVHAHGAVVYVLPETRSIARTFGAFDVPQAAAQTAARRAG